MLYVPTELLAELNGAGVVAGEILHPYWGVTVDWAPGFRVTWSPDPRGATQWLRTLQEIVDKVGAATRENSIVDEVDRRAAEPNIALVATQENSTSITALALQGAIDGAAIAGHHRLAALAERICLSRMRWHRRLIARRWPAARARLLRSLEYQIVLAALSAAIPLLALKGAQALGSADDSKISKALLTLFRTGVTATVAQLDATITAAAPELAALLAPEGLPQETIVDQIFERAEVRK
jgi:hypothetical protein